MLEETVMGKKAPTESWNAMCARQDEERRAAEEARLQHALLMGANRDADEDDPNADPNAIWNDIDE